MSRQEFAAVFQDDTLSDDDIYKLFFVADTDQNERVCAKEVAQLLQAGIAMLEAKNKHEKEVIKPLQKTKSGNDNTIKKQTGKEPGLKVQLCGSTGQKVVVRVSAGGRAFEKEVSDKMVKVAVRFSEAECRGPLELTLKREDGSERKERLEWAGARKAANEWSHSDVNFGQFGKLKVKLKWSVGADIEEMQGDQLDELESTTWFCETDFAGKVRVTIDSV